ncbi:TonB-dependent receptor plug domain-containing protein [Azotobacter vinelandii]
MQHPASRLPLLAGGLCLCLNGLSQADDNVFELGQIFVLGSHGDASRLDNTDSVDSRDMRLHDRETVGEALNLIPGVSLSKTGARNEQMVYVRGFDLRQVPVFIDGIPVYVPYDGYPDLGRFTTFELSRIEVSKGFSSMTYGPNTLGGAINLVTRRPQEEFEGEIGTGFSFTDRAENNGEWTYANFGTRQDNWWAQMGLSYLNEDYFRLPGNFDDERLEDGGRRGNSDRKDKKINFKVGFTPNDTDEYVLGYVKQDGEKGNPAYAGHLGGSYNRFWRWPKWDKTSYYINTVTAFGDHKVKARLYHDIYKNDLYSYDNDSYSTQKTSRAFRSYYDDYSTGLSLEDEWTLDENNQLRLAFHHKQDVHREHDAGEPKQRFEDETQSLALEYTRKLTERLALIAGFSHDRRNGREAETYTSAAGLFEEEGGRESTNNGQLGLFFQADPRTLWRFTVARKSRFPTMKDRYSYRFGSALPNPDLKTEEATHFEIGYKRALSDSLELDLALFRSHVDDLLQSVRVAGSACSNPPCSQMQNVSEVRMNGVEASLNGNLGAWEVNFNYLYLNRQNRSSDDSIRLTDTPKHKGFLSIGRQFGPWHLMASSDASSSRYSSTDGTQEASGFVVFDLKGGYRFDNGLQLDASVQNLTDHEYEYSEGYPEPGRTFVVQANLTF